MPLINPGFRILPNLLDGVRRSFDPFGEAYTILEHDPAAAVVLAGQQTELVQSPPLELQHTPASVSLVGQNGIIEPGAELDHTAASVSLVGQSHNLQQGTAPTWTATFANLPDATVGIPYSVNLKDYGADIDEVHAVASSLALSDGDGIWPAGLSLNTSTGVLSGTPTVVGEVAVVNAIGVNGTHDGDADWAIRSALSGVQKTENFPDNASVRDISDAMSGTPARSIWTGTAGDNTQEKLSGNGALRQQILDVDVYEESANWRMPIKSDESAMAVGESVYACWSVKYNRAEASWRFAQSGGGQIHQLKLGIIDTLTTASSFEVVLQTRYGLPRGYTGLTPSVQWETSRATPCSGSDFVFQPEIDKGVDQLAGVDPGLPSGNGAASAWTACQKNGRYRYGGLYTYWAGGGVDGVPDPLTGGAFMLADWWQSWQVRVSRITSSSTLVEWWWAPLGMDWELMYSDTVARGGAYQYLHMTNSHTNMAAESGVRPTCERVTDQIITRTSMIPAPGFA